MTNPVDPTDPGLVAETQKQRIDRLTLGLKVLSNTIEAAALLGAFPAQKIGVMLFNPADGTAQPLAWLQLDTVKLKALADAEVEWRLAAMNQDHVQL